jgi:hypothetical protein
MEKIIYIGDLQAKEQEPYKSACINVLKYLLKHHKDDIVIQGGDFFNSSRHSHDFVDEIAEILLQFKDFRIIPGNHDQSYALGNILKSLGRHNNITIYHGIEKININGIDFQIIPYQYGNLKEKCEKITEDCDYSLSHLTPIQEAFSNEGVEFKFKAKVAHVYAHIHRYREFVDNFGNKCLIAGVVSTSRFGEQEWENNIYELRKDKFIKIPLPKFMDIVTIQYGEEIADKNILYNVENAPDMSSVYEKYKGFYIRREGVTYAKTDDSCQIDFSLDNNLGSTWQEFSNTEKMESSIVNEGVKQIEIFQGEKHEK